MLSFNDAFSKEDIKDWLNRISKLLPESDKKNLDFYCELKIDGLEFLLRRFQMLHLSKNMIYNR